MRYPSSEKLEIIRLVEQSHLPVRQTVEKLGIQPSRFYRWYDRLQTGGPEALEDKTPRPKHVWNRIPDAIRERIVQLALDEPELSPRELATYFTDTANYFVSGASVYRLLKAHDLITSPAYIVVKAADEFKDKTTAPNQLWQTDFTYLKVTGWGWFYLSTVLDDFSRYILAWKPCTTMSADDVTDTLAIALQASGLDKAPRDRRPRLLSDHGPSYVANDLADWLEDQGMRHTRGKPYHPMTQGKIERWHLSLKSRILLEHYYLPGDLERAVAGFVEHCHRQWETDPGGNMNLTHRIRWFLLLGGADAEGGGTDGTDDSEETRGEHPFAQSVDGSVAEYGAALPAGRRGGGGAEVSPQAS